MKILTFVPSYLMWHYSRALSDMAGICRNFISFFYRFFSIPILLRTLFAPLDRLGESYGRGFEHMFGTFVINTIMRVIGAVARIFIIILGTITLIFACVASLSVCVVWLVLPILIVWLFTQGFIFVL